MPKPIAKSVFRSRRRGGALLAMVGMLLVMSLIGLAIIGLTQTTTQTRLSTTTGSRAHYLAESGIQYAQYQYCEGEWNGAGKLEMALEGDYEVTIEVVDGKFHSEATIHPGTAMMARAEVTAEIEECWQPPQIHREDFLILGNQNLKTSQSSALDVEAGLLGDSLASLFLELNPANILGTPGIDVRKPSGVQNVVNVRINAFKGGFAGGSVGAIDAPVHIESNVEGNVVGSHVGITDGVTVTGNVYSTADTVVGNGLVVGDIYSRGDVYLGYGNRLIARTSGSVYAAGDVYIGGQSIVDGDVHAGGEVRIEGDAHVKGSVRGRKDVTLEGGTVIDYLLVIPFGAKGTARVDGDVHSGGSIEIKNNAQIGGDAVAAVEVDGTAVSGDRRENFEEPAAPISPERFWFEGHYGLPVVRSVNPGTTIIESEASKPWPSPSKRNYPTLGAYEPGDYGRINLALGNWRTTLSLGGILGGLVEVGHFEEKQLTLMAGTYQIESLEMGTEGVLRIDFSNGQDFRMFVAGDVLLGQSRQPRSSLLGLLSGILDRLLGGGGFQVQLYSEEKSKWVSASDPSVAHLASRIYLEVHGKFEMKQNSTWIGTIYTPNSRPDDDELALKVGSGSVMTGAFYSRGGHNLSNATLRYVKPKEGLIPE